MRTPINEIQVLDLRMQVRRVLHGRILLGELKPGELYTVKAVASALGVSVTPVREALLELASKGIVEFSRNRGFYVPELTPQEVSELVQVRLLLEVPAMMKVAEIYNGIIDAELDGILDSMRSAATVAAGGTPSDYLEICRNFHELLLSVLHMPTLSDMILSLRDRARVSGLARHNGFETATDEHHLIVKAIRAKDIEATRELVSRHVLHHELDWAADTPSASPVIASDMRLGAINIRGGGL